MPQIVVKLGDNVVQRFSFDKDIVNIGRSRDNDITIDNLAVSRSHCRIRRVDDKYILTDLNSANGSYVNGVKISKTEVMKGDVISVGKHKLVFELEEVKEEEAIGDAFGADRTMIVENTTDGILTVTKGKGRGTKHKISKYETKIGRAPDNDIVIGDWFVSKTHAKVLKQGNTFILKDLGSWKGSFVNDQPVKEPTPLKEGDELRFGSTKLRFSIFDEKKRLQIEGRRPQELGYDASASAELPSMPPPLAAEEPEEAVAGPPGGGARTFRMDVSELAKHGVFPEDEEFEEPADSAIPPPLSDAERMVPAAEDEEEDEFEFDFEELPEPEAVPQRPSVQSPAQSGAEPQAPSGGGDGNGVVWRDFTLQEEDEMAPASAGSGERPAIEKSLESGGGNREASSPSVAVEEEDPKARQIRMWEKALQNRSPIIRKQAAKMLKKLTGKDYDIDE